jgi:hypothetical protein
VLKRSAVAATVLAAALSPTAPAASAGRPTSAAPIVHADPPSIDRLPQLPLPRGGLLGHPMAAQDSTSASPTDVLAALPGLWCGAERSSDDTTHQLDNGAYRYHAIYALPAGTPDRFRAVAGTLQADAFRASQLLERLYHRAIRFDMGTGCGSQYLDISVVHLPQSAASLSQLAAANPSGLLAQLADDLTKAGFDPLPMTATADLAMTKQVNYVVWLDGVSGAAGVCGVGSEYDDTRRDFSNINNYGGKLALVLRDGTGFCNSNTVRHEIGHNLGALLPVAPSAFDGAHCDDAYEDTMCYPNAPRRSGGGYEGEYFDFGNNDYWDPQGGALPWWTVNLSHFLCPNVSCNVPTSSGDVGAVGGALIGAVGDTLQGLFVSCPEGQIFASNLCKANGGSSGAEVVRRATPKPSIVYRARRLTAHRWRVSVRLRTTPRAMVTLRCRRAGRAVRAQHPPVTKSRPLSATVRCDTRPRASARVT